MDRGADLGVRAVRGGGAAHPAAGEGPLHRRPGHRRPDPRPSAPAWTGRSSSTRTTSSASRSWPGSTPRPGPAAGRAAAGGRSVVPRRGEPDRGAAAAIAGRITSSRMSPTLRPLDLPRRRSRPALAEPGHRGHRAAARTAATDPARTGDASTSPTWIRPEASRVVPGGAPGLVGLARSPIAQRRRCGVMAGWEVSGRRASRRAHAHRLHAAGQGASCGPPSHGRGAAALGVPVRPDAARRWDGTLVVGSGPGEWLLLRRAGRGPGGRPRG